ncbi:hypothetical protein J5N97_021420 [Dioscorea zingiberensis]|uniref:Pentatricopeptide repeat-containing protein n=1 Tax=Dioscorea zingiberensis TaxID=325984 RepID=A0A9D5CHJ6_9LILI|nr:hypothetical protein J5N97_021420 [Dioscorea zingiberensis]
MRRAALLLSNRTSSSSSSSAAATTASSPIPSFPDHDIASQTPSSSPSSPTQDCSKTPPSRASPRLSLLSTSLISFYRSPSASTPPCPSSAGSPAAPASATPSTPTAPFSGSSITPDSMHHPRRSPANPAGFLHIRFYNDGNDGCRPNAHTLAVLIHGLCKEKRLADAEVLLSESSGRGLVPNVVCYNVLVHGYCKKGEIDAAWRIMEYTRTYNELIHGYCEAGKVPEAMALLSKMSEAGVCPSVVTYTALICGYCKKREIDAALRIMESMALNRCRPDTRTYNELIHGYCEAGKVHEAMALLSKMNEAGVCPSVVTYTALIHGYCKKGEIDSAFRLLDLISGNCLVPDQRTYSILIDALCKNGRTEEAYSLFNSLGKKNIRAHEEKGVEPTVLTYNMFIRTHCSEGSLKEAENLMAEMNDNGPMLLFERKYIDRLSAYHLEVWNAVKMDKIHELLEQMNSRGSIPDVNTYDVLIKCLCNCGRIEEAKHLLFLMEEATISPSEDIYTALAYVMMEAVRRLDFCLGTYLGKGIIMMKSHGKFSLMAYLRKVVLSFAVMRILCSVFPDNYGGRNMVSCAGLWKRLVICNHVW